MKITRHIAHAANLTLKVNQILKEEAGYNGRFIESTVSEGINGYLNVNFSSVEEVMPEDFLNIEKHNNSKEPEDHIEYGSGIVTTWKVIGSLSTWNNPNNLVAIPGGIKDGYLNGGCSPLIGKIQIRMEIIHEEVKLARRYDAVFPYFQRI